MEPKSHDTDVKALLRIAVVWNIPVACNRASADSMISSTLMTGQYERLVADYEPYRERLAAAPVAEEPDEAGLESEPAVGSEDGAIAGAARS